VAQSLLNPPRGRTSENNENNNKLRTNKHHELASSGSCSSSLGPLLVTAWFRALWTGHFLFLVTVRMLLLSARPALLASSP